MTFTANQDSSTVALNEIGTPPTLNLEYRINKGKWIPYVYGTIINYNKSNIIQFRNADDIIRTQVSNGNGNNYRKFVLTGNPLVSGNICSLLDKKCKSSYIGKFGLANLFSNCEMEQSLNLPIFEIGGQGSLLGLFINSTISNPIVIKIKNPLQDSIRSMFQNCRNLLKADIIIEGSFVSYSMIGLFYNCKNIREIHINRIDSQSSVITYCNNNCECFVIDDLTPPNIHSNAITGLKSDCIIYVPDESVDAYKAAQYWSDRAAYIKGISEKP